MSLMSSRGLLPRPLLHLTCYQLSCMQAVSTTGLAPLHQRLASHPRRQPLSSFARLLSSTRQPSSSPTPAITTFALPPPWVARLPASLRWTHPYLSLARLDKPIGTWLLYWPCAWSITMAAYSAHLPVGTWLSNLALFGTGALVMRGAGCTINDMWDRDIDKKVERTKLRPLASGEVTPFKALSFLGIQLSIGLAVLTQLNWYSIALGASSLSVVILYPLMKRITYWPQFVLGLAFNWGALLGSSAMLGFCNWAVALPLYIGSIAWTIVYDTIYAHQDKTDDVDAGVKSTALLFGDKTKPVLAGFGTSFVGLLAYAGYLNGQGVPFYAVSVAGAAAHIVWQLRHVNLESRESCWRTFASNRDLGTVVFSGLAIDYGLQASGLLV